jgi:signal transduction histidine kinase
LTLRLRLTLLYGVVFLFAAGGLLTATYALFKHGQASAAQTFSVHAGPFTLPPDATRAFGIAARQRIPGSSSGNVRTTIVRGGGVAHGSTSVGVPPGATQVLTRIRASGQKQLLFLAARANQRLGSARASDARSLLEWSAIALAAVALLSIGMAWWLSGRALRPLRTMNARAREISAESLHRRLGLDDRHDEIGELATTFDALLERLEAAFESQRRFVANASHELRTPLTLERTLVEVALADPDASLDSLRLVCERVVASTEAQERMLDALLTLARSEAGVAAGEQVDLAVLVAEALLQREPRLTGVTVERALEPALVIGDRALLERLVANLLDNAIVHNSGDERWIRIATSVTGGTPGLRIANGGLAVSVEDAESMFEPFRRGVGERLGSDDGGLGLGLSIVRAVTLAHGAEITAQPLAEGGIEFELRFLSAASGKPPVGGLQPVSV